MRETPRAKQAFNDYLQMSDGRSLEKLAEAYQSRTDSVPTRQLSRLKRWSQVHGWQRRLEEIAEAQRRAIVARGIAEKQNRIGLYDDLANRLKRVMAARASAYRDEPLGGDTGVVVRQVKLVKVYNSDEEVPPEEAEAAGGETLYSAKKSVEVYEYPIDAALVKELRELAKAAAVEKGEWNEGDAVLKHLDLSKLSNEQLERLADGDEPIKVLLGR